MDLSKMIDLLAEVAVRRAARKREVKPEPDSDAVLLRLAGLRHFTSLLPAIYPRSRLRTVAVFHQR